MYITNDGNILKILSWYYCIHHYFMGIKHQMCCISALLGFLGGQTFLKAKKKTKKKTNHQVYLYFIYCDTKSQTSICFLVSPYLLPLSLPTPPLACSLLSILLVLICHWWFISAVFKLDKDAADPAKSKVLHVCLHTFALETYSNQLHVPS